MQNQIVSQFTHLEFRKWIRPVFYTDVFPSSAIRPTIDVNSSIDVSTVSGGPVKSPSKSKTMSKSSIERIEPIESHNSPGNPIKSPSKSKTPRSLKSASIVGTSVSSLPTTRPSSANVISSSMNPSNITLLIDKHQSLWPFISIISPLLFRLNNTSNVTLENMKITLKILILLTKSNDFDESHQPLIYDCFSSVFLSLGGGILISSLCGRFSLYKRLFDENKRRFDENESVFGFIYELYEWLVYLINRSVSREKYWDDWMLTHKDVIEIDPKTGKVIEYPSFL